MNLGFPLGDGFRFQPNLTDLEQHAQTEVGRTFAHNGIHVGLVAGGILYHLLRVGALEAHLKLYHATSTSAPLKMELSESPTVTAAGTLALVNNKLRTSTIPNTARVYEATTISAVGLHLEGDIIVGAKQEGGSQSGIDDEWILAPNKDYLFTVTNNATATVDVNFHLEWYETE